MDASFNQLTGTVPSWLAALSPSVSSSNLLFNNNQLSGPLPTAVAAVYPAGSSTWSNTCVVNCSTVYAGCDLSDRAALVDLFVATNVSDLGWIVSTNWLTPAHPCSWNGVICNGTSAVVQISLIANNLVGTLPSSIGSMTALTYGRRCSQRS